MRIPVAVDLESRDGGLDQDALLVNCIAEPRGEGVAPEVFVRPGVTDEGLVRVGTAQLLTYWNGAIRTVIGDYLGGLDGTQSSITWNPSDKAAGITLSNGNLTVTTPASGNTAVRSTVAFTSGDYFWQVTPSSGLALIGVANGSESMTAALGLGAHSLAYVGSTGNIIRNGVTVINVATFATNDVIGLLYNSSLRTLKFFKNGVLLTTIADANLPTGNLYAAVGDNGAGTVSSTVFGITSLSLAPSTAGLPFSSQDNGANAPKNYLMVKNANQAWTIDVSETVAQITDADYPGTYTVTLTSLTRSGTTATATTATDTNFQVGSTVTIAGATPSDYNGAKVITGITPSSSTGATPAVAVTITRTGTTATATCINEPHGLTNGQNVLIEGAGQSEYNGTKAITWVSPTVFTFTVTVSNAITSPATTVLGAFGPELGGIGASSNVGLSISGGTATVTWGGHGKIDGAFVQVSYIYTDTLGNGGQKTLGGAITVLDANRFTIATANSDTDIIALPHAFQYLPAISSITGSATTGLATVTTSSPHKLTTTNFISMSGAAQSYYNVFGVPLTITGTSTFTYPLGIGAESPATPATGTITATGVAAAVGASFTFTIAGSPATPATGTITATGGRNTVPGIVHIDGFFVVMDVNGVIYNSAEDDPSTWNALEYVIAQAETGAGAAIAKSLDFIVAFKEWSTEPFYNAGLSPGSPFRPVDNGFTQVGCAAGWSVADVGGQILWIAQSRRFKGRAVYAMTGTEQRKVSTPDIERILTADALTTVHAYGVKLGAHQLYVLTLVASNTTLIYDLNSGLWYVWTSNTLGSSKSVSSITRSNDLVTVVTAVPHTVVDGAPFQISGANQSAYNEKWQASYVDASTLQIEVTGSPTTPATGTILLYPYTETYLKFTKYANCGGRDIVLHESDGHLYEWDHAEFRDAGIPINAFIRSQRVDGGDSRNKALSRLVVIGDKSAAKMMARWSDDDCATYTKYRRIDLSRKRPSLRRCASFRRRTFELRHVENYALRIKELEMEVE